MKKAIKQKIENRMFSRRQFLIGTGGQVLFLPPLLSLMTRQAQAATIAHRRLCLFPMQFGMHTSYLRPTEAQLSGKLTQIKPDIYSAPLSALPKPVSFVVDNEWNDLLNDMNLFYGLGHSHTGSHSFGHFCSSAATIPSDSTNRKPTYGKSIDVIIEQSEAFKATFSGSMPTIRAATLNTNGKVKSWDRNLGAEFPTGMPFYIGDQSLFNAVFGSTTIPLSDITKNAARKNLIVDSVLTDLQSLNNNKRLSKVDKEMVDRYITSLHDLEKNITASTTAASCSKPVFTPQMVKGTLTGSVDQLFKNYNEIVTLAFACDQSRMFMLDNHYGSSSGQGLPHHEADDIENQGTDRSKWYIKKIADMARRMKAFPDPSGNGSSLLDNSLFIVINEHSERRTHSSQDIPVLTFGSLGGAVRSGLYLDYRLEGHPFFSRASRPYGYPTKQLLQTALVGMGVPKTEYTKYGDGNGFGQFTTEAATNYHAKFAATHNNPLDYFTKV